MSNKTHGGIKQNCNTLPLRASPNLQITKLHLWKENLWSAFRECGAHVLAQKNSGNTNRDSMHWKPEKIELVKLGILYVRTP